MSQKLVLQHTDQILLEAPNHYPYELQIYVPPVEAPPEGFPVYYVLDGRMYGLYVSAMIMNQIRNSPKTGVDPAIVVAICHREEDHAVKRFYDFTAPAKQYKLPERLQHRKDYEFGGAEDFTSFISDSIIPYIDKHYNTNASKRALIGHSLGGYYSLWLLLQQRPLFHVHAAISPSIWWNDYELLTLAKSKAHNSDTSKDLIMAVGELEGTMVDDAINIDIELKKQVNRYQFSVISDENHASVVPTVLCRILRFCNKSFANIE